MVCPQCCGEGIVTVLMKTDGYVDEVEQRYAIVQCGICAGEGQIPESDLPAANAKMEAE